MKTPDEDNLDRLFREGLTGPDGNAEFREEDWAAMEQLLDERPKRRKGITGLYWFLGSIAAILLLFFGWELLNTSVPATIKITKTPVKKAWPIAENKAAKVKKSKETVFPNGKNPEQRTGSDLAENKHRSNSYKVVASAAKKIADKNSIATNASTQNAITDLASNKTSTRKKGINAKVIGSNKDTQNKVLVENYQDLKATEVNTISNQQKLVSNSIVKLDTSFTASNSAKTKPVLAKAKKASPVLKTVPRVVLAILTAPDVNGVKSLSNGMIGTNAGIQVHVQLSKRWSVATGAAYATKPYEITSNAYSGGYVYPGGTTTSVVADCRVLDIPLTLNYQIYGNPNNTFSVGTGLSSYLMLREHYQFNYSDNTEWSYNIANKNKHILSVLNLNATYTHQLNSNFNLMVQPYIKLPLSHIGYERVDLQSAGVAVGVGWNIGSLKIK